MTDDVWHRKEIESPCQKICMINPDNGYCIGCLRTRDEIAQWSRLSKNDRTAIIAVLNQRRIAAKPKRRGGSKRQNRHKNSD